MPQSMAHFPNSSPKLPSPTTETELDGSAFAGRSVRSIHGAKFVLLTPLIVFGVLFHPKPPARLLFEFAFRPIAFHKLCCGCAIACMNAIFFCSGHLGLAGFSGRLLRRTNALGRTDFCPFELTRSACHRG